MSLVLQCQYNLTGDMSMVLQCRIMCLVTRVRYYSVSIKCFGNMFCPCMKKSVPELMSTHWR